VDTQSGMWVELSNSTNIAITINSDQIVTIVIVSR